MPQLQPIKAKQVKQLGETPAQAAKRVAAERRGEATVEQPKGTEVEGPLTPAHMAAIEAEDGGFKDTGVSDGPPQELEELTEPPTPSKAMDMIRQLSQDKNQLQTELDAALNLVQRYRREHGELD